MDWSKSNKKLYAVVHGRDDLARLWPNHFSKWESALLPSEEFVEIEMGDDFGWPYCYYDQMQNKKVLAPELIKKIENNFFDELKELNYI